MTGFSTNAVHKGQSPDPTTGAMVPPVYLTSTYAQEWPGRDKGYDYTRAGNPNFTNFEHQMAALEGGKYATACASGLSTVTALCTGMPKGACVAGIKSMYGGTYRLLKRVFEPQGVEILLVQFGEWEKLEEILRTKKPHYFICESPTNPLLEVVDIKMIGQLCKKYGVLSVVDNTFASPYIQKPLSLGIDIVIHSCTKYIGGHSDVIGGVVITDIKEINDKVQFNRLALGLNPSPFDVWLLSRSVKTLSIRMEKHSKNALEIAKWLETKTDIVEKVIYPGLESHPQHEIAKKQMINGFSGMISAVFKLSLYQTKVFLSKCKVFSLGESLGGVESLIESPSCMTHASIPREERLAIGLQDSLVRLSVGIEDSKDLIEDIAQAFNFAKKQPLEEPIQCNVVHG